LEVEKTRTRGLYPVCALLEIVISEWRKSCQLTSPIARYFPSGLREVQVHALTRSLAAQVFPPGESFDSPGPGVPKAVAVAPVSRSDGAVVRLRRSEDVLVGVEGSYIAGEGLRGIAVGRAR
jgi:hypothetical protein